jgi:hypothetical protein
MIESIHEDITYVKLGFALWITRENSCLICTPPYESLEDEIITCHPNAPPH